MQIKYTHRRLGDVLRTRFKKYFSVRNILTVIVSLILLGSIAPFVINYFVSDTYLDTTLFGGSGKNISVAALIYPADTNVLIDFDRAYLFAPDTTTLRDYSSGLDASYPDVMFTPDYAATNVKEFCGNLVDLEPNLENVAIIGKRGDVIRMAYACDNAGLEVTIHITEHDTLAETFQTGVKLIELIFQL